MPGSACRVLVVEDDEDILALMRGALRRAGFEVLATPSGQEALRAVREGCFDVVVTDLAMPAVGGVEVIRALRQGSRGARTPVIAVSAHAGGPLGREALEAGCEAILPKPFSRVELLEAVRACVERAQPSDGHGSAGTG